MSTLSKIALYGIGVFAVSASCTEKKSQSGVNLDTRNSAGNPFLQLPDDSSVPSDAPRIIDRDLENPDDLKVISVETSNVGLNIEGFVDPRNCTKTRESGPRGRSNYDCTDYIRTRVSETARFEGILLQDWTSNQIQTGNLWNLENCRASRITISMNQERLKNVRDGVSLYLGKPRDNRTLPVVTRITDREFSSARVNGNSIEADFIVVAKCGDGPVEFKPYFDDGDDHFWPRGANSLID